MARTRLTTAEIQKAIQKIRQVQTPTIDGEVLANMAEICHKCALKNHEVRGLNIGDVSQSGIARNTISVNGTPIPISDWVKTIVQNHMNHLKKAGHRFYPKKPLFPQKKSGSRYTPESLNNHIDNCLNNIDSGFRLENIRQAGIRDHFYKLLKQGMSANECLKQTADLARVDKNDSSEMRHLKNLLDGEIQSTGNKSPKPGEFEYYLENIEYAANYRRKNVELILDQLEMNMYEITTKEKKSFYEEALDPIWSKLNQIKNELNKEPKLDSKERVESIKERLNKVNLEINRLKKSNCEEIVESNLLDLEEIYCEIAEQPKLNDEEKLECILQHLEDLRNEIKSARQLSNDVKKQLNKMINDEKKKITDSFSTQNSPPVGEFKSIADAIKNFNPENDKHDSSSMDWARCFGYDEHQSQNEKRDIDSNKDLNKDDEAI